MTYLLNFSPTHLRTYAPTHLRTYAPTHLRTYARNTIFTILFSMMLVIPNLFSQNLCTLEAIAGCKENTTAQFKLITNSSTFSQLVASTVLLPAAQAASNPQYLVVCGTLTNDISSYTFAPGSEIIFTTNNSGITVASSKKLICVQAYLHGCTKLWKGIEVLGNAQLELRGARVEDGINAVRLKPLSALNCTDSKFNGNLTGIYAGDTGQPNQHSIKFYMLGTTISGSKPLVEQYSVPFTLNSSCTTTTPVYGIYVQNTKTLPIGVVNYAINSIEDFKNTIQCSLAPNPTIDGILAIQSNLKVVNTKFKNIGNGSGGVCLHFSSDIFVPSSLSFTGLGISNSSPNTFEAAQRGVIANGNYQITNSKFRDLYEGIVQNHLQNAPFTCNISNNDFANIHENTIFIDNVFPVAGLNISNNRLSDDSNFDYSLAFVPRWGVYLKNFAPAATQPSTINSNIFINQPKANTTQSGAYTGVRVANVNGTLIRFNTFIDNYTNSPQQYIGAQLFNSMGRLYENTFNGAGNFASHPSTAVEVGGSPMTWLSCNQFNNQRIGVRCVGNSNASRFDLNQFNTHQIGLRLEQTAVIGQQMNLQNRWIATTTLPNIEALFDGSPTAMWVGNSRFFIHNLDQTTSFWPIPRFWGSIQDPGTWFVDGSPSTVTCAQPTANDEAPELAQPEPSAYEKSIINGTFEPIYGYEADKMSAHIQLYAKLLKHPEWLTNNSAISTWFNAQQNTGISNLGTVYKAIAEDMATISPAENAGLKQKYSEISAKLEEIASIDEAIGQAIDNATLTNTLSNLREQKSAQLDIKTTEAGSLMANIRQNQQSRANAALPLINSLPSSEEYTADLKTMFTIYAQTVLSGSAPSESTYKTIQQISEKCLYSGGLAVKLARASSNKVLDWEAFDKDCTQTANRESGFSATLSGRIYPNPAKDYFTFKLKSKSTNGHLELRDMLGVVIKTWKFENVEQVDCQLPATLPSGIYSIIFTNENKRLEVYQLSVNNND